MAKTKTITVIQEVLVPHNETKWRTWYAVVQRTIEREIDTAGNVVREEFISEEDIETCCNLEEETTDSDENPGDEEIVSEEFEEEYPGEV
jgi:hypothetical protein